MVFGEVRRILRTEGCFTFRREECFTFRVPVYSRAGGNIFSGVKDLHFVKVHTAGSDFLVCEGVAKTETRRAARLLDRHTGVGGEGVVLILPEAGDAVHARLILPDGSEGEPCATAAIAAAKYLFDREKIRSATRIRLGNAVYPVRLTVMGSRVLCAWAELPPIMPRPLEQLKYYHGIRGEVLRACLVNPRVSIYGICGAHAVFLLESCAALRALNLKSVCGRLSEVLFYGERIRLHFAAVSGDNALAMRSYEKPVGECAASGEGAAVVAYAARAASLADEDRVLVKCLGGTFCVDLDGTAASLCAKCETVFSGDAG